jgi:hypothetical protein
MTAPLTASVDAEIAFAVRVGPSSADLPITYTWTPTWGDPITRTAGLTDTMVFSWTFADVYTVTVTATNGCGKIVTATASVEVVDSSSAVAPQGLFPVHFGLPFLLPILAAPIAGLPHPP